MKGYGITVDVSKIRRGPITFLSKPADHIFDAKEMRKVWFDEPKMWVEMDDYKPLPTHNRKGMFDIFNRTNGFSQL